MHRVLVYELNVQNVYFVGIWKFIKTHNGKQGNQKPKKKHSTGAV